MNKSYLLIVLSILAVHTAALSNAALAAAIQEEKKDFIKWMDFKPTNAAMTKALEYDVASHGSDTPLDWVELLAYLAAKYGGDFDRYREADIRGLRDRLLAGENIDEITKDMKYYRFYSEAYRAVLGGFVGEYSEETPDKNNLENKVWVEKYGLKAFSPLARGYDFSHFDDFGNSRTYGYRRVHLGHDIFARTGAPIIAVESGIVENMGWNRFGGWRIGIRSFDGMRYYYYAHLRKDKPYHGDMVEGSIVKAGDVIGYLGRTGYSYKENVNGIDQPHLHFGMQVIFDESQRDSTSEIWLDVYELTKFLQKNRSLTKKDEFSGDYYRIYDFFEPGVIQQ